MFDNNTEQAAFIDNAVTAYDRFPPNYLEMEETLSPSIWVVLDQLWYVTFMDKKLLSSMYDEVDVLEEKRIVKFLTR